VHPCYTASINVKKAEKAKSVSSRQTGFKKIPNNFFFLPTLLKNPKQHFLKPESLKFGIKLANLATPGTTLGCWCAALSK